MNQRLDPRLYLVTDRALCLHKSLIEVVLEAVRGGTTLVQLREKELSTRDFVTLGRALRERLEPLGVPLLINDRVDVALACGAAGVHLGQSDLSPQDARSILGPEALIGWSIENSENAVASEHMAVDYLSVSPVFATQTKTDTVAPLGLEFITRLRRSSRVPVIGIGGIHAANAESVIRAGAHGIAIVSAICSAPCPQSAASSLLHIVNSTLASQVEHHD